MPDRLLALVTAAALFGTGCAGLIEQPRIVAVDLGRPEMQQFDVVKSRTSLERDSALDSRSDRGSREVTPVVFWSGIALGTLGAIGTIGFAAAGRVNKDRFNALYSGGSATHEQIADIQERGKLWNTMTITSAALMAVGYVVAIVTYGVDWNRCGALAPPKRKCRPSKR